MADFWRVNSYGYPNPFSENKKHLDAWSTLESFFQFRSYSDLKGYWQSDEAPRRIKPHAVESWKAAFEEYGLLHVLTGSDQIRITPGGEQFMSAAERQAQSEWAWVGLNLLLRYTLRGTRRARSGAHEDSDLLLYWFWFAALRELNNYVWWPEITHVLCKTFSHAQSEGAISQIRQLRAGDLLLEQLRIPAPTSRGAFYNSLNQVPNHASLGYMLMDKTQDMGLYNATEAERRHEILPEWRPLIDEALGDRASAIECESSSTFIARMPTAPIFTTEESYFEYAGARVEPRPVARIPGVLRTVRFGPAGVVLILSQGRDFDRREGDTIIGSIAMLCNIAREQRVVLVGDMTRTYLVAAKGRTESGEIRITLRPARPITSAMVMEKILEGNDA